MKKVKLIVELAFIFLLPLLFIALTCSIKTVKEYDENNNEINKLSYIESSYPFSDYKSSDKYINYLVLNQLVKNGNFVDSSDWYGLAFNVSNNSLTFAVDTSYNGVYCFVDLVASHKYYLSLYVDSLNADNVLQIGLSDYSTFTTPIYSDVPYLGSHYYSGVIDVPTSANSRFFIRSGNSNNYNEFSLSKVMLFDLTVMFGVGYEPSSDDFLNYVNVNDYIDYGTQEIIVYSENNNISVNWQYNYSPWGNFIHLVIDYLYLTDTPLLRILLMYFIMFMLMFLLWHVVYLPIDWIVHLGTKPLKE